MTVHPMIRPTCPQCGEDSAVKKKQAKWYCHRCKAPLPDRSEPTPVLGALAPAFVDTCHERLMSSEASLAWLLEYRHIDLATVLKRRLGLESGRIMIPIPGEDGWVNIRTAKPGEKLRPFEKGRSVQLYPGVIEPCSRLLICEGEWDKLAAEALGFDSCCGTGGAGVFHAGWAVRIAEAVEEVVLVFDVDPAGRAGARRAADRLLEAGLHARQIRNVQLPLAGKKDSKDLTDWIRAGGTADQLTELIESTPTLSPADIVVGLVPENAPHRTLAEAGDKLLARQWSWFPGSILALVTDSYQLPKKISLGCPQDQGKLCSTCRMPEMVMSTPPGEPPIVELDVTDDRFVEHIGTPKSKLREQVLASIGVSPKCPVVEVDDLEVVAVQEGRIADTLSVDADRTAAERSAIFVDLEGTIASNQEYEMLGRCMPHPRDQIWTAVIHRARGIDQVVERYSEDRALLKPLRKRRKLENTLRILLDDAAEITGIRGRDDMHLLVLLSMLSTLWLDTTGGRERGWLDVAIVGDTSEGKTRAVEKLQADMGLGAVIALKRTTTRAGLFGGVTQERKKNVIAWGVLPRSDKRWLALDEVHTADPALISAMTSARSKGIAETYMVGIAAQTNCRVRLCWLMNPRSDRSVREHSHGIDVVTQGFRRPEDIRRLDAALVVAKGEVDPDLLSPRAPKDPVLLVPGMLNHLALRAWSQRGVNVDHLLSSADGWRKTLGSRYLPTPPLLEPSDLPWKVLRLAVALANLLAVEPTEDHVDYAGQMLDRIYSSEVSGFRALSEIERTRASLADEQAVWSSIQATGNSLAVVDLLLLQSEWHASDFNAIVLNGEPALGAQLLSILIRNRAMVREGRAYHKTEAFTVFLKRKRGELCP